MLVLKRCQICGGIKHCPFQITLEKNGLLKLCNVCKPCKEKHLQESPKPTESLDLSHITTPTQLLDFLSSVSGPVLPPCECGLTEEEFDVKGKFGCDKCYDHFKDKMEKFVIPYHKGETTHFGKRPLRKEKNEIENDPIKKKQLLKLQLVRALEFEEYEKASLIKKEIEAISESLP